MSLEKPISPKTLFLDRKGVSLIELLIVLAIFSVVMAGLYSAYKMMTNQGILQYKIAQSEMEFQIAKSVLDRDIAMAGYGIADNYCASTSLSASCVSQSYCSDPAAPSFGLCVPIHLKTGPSPTSLIMMGTALGRESRAAQVWSITTTTAPTTASSFRVWADTRENPRSGTTPPANSDKMIYINPSSKSLLYTDLTSPNSTTGKTWLFPFPGGGSNPYPSVAATDDGLLVYGMTTSVSAGTPYYVVKYSLDSSNLPSNCAPGTSNLMRLESKSDPPSGSGQPLMNCVLDFEIALGLDVNDDGGIECWDYGPTCTGVYGYPTETLRKQLKQVKVFILAQEGNRDPNYTHNTNPIRVGDLNLKPCIVSGMTCTSGAGAVGPNITLTPEQLHYRWKLLTSDIAPKNIR